MKPLLLSLLVIIIVGQSCKEPKQLKEDTQVQRAKEYADSSIYYLQMQTEFIRLESAAAVRYSELKDEKYYNEVVRYSDSANKYYSLLRNLKMKP